MKASLRWPRWFICLGVILVVVAFVTPQAVYIEQFLTKGDSIRVTQVFQQSVLLSSILVAFGIFDAVALVLLVQETVKWWRLRSFPKK